MSYNPYRRHLYYQHVPFDDIKHIPSDIVSSVTSYLVVLNSNDINLKQLIKAPDVPPETISKILKYLFETNSSFTPENSRIDVINLLKEPYIQEISHNVDSCGSSRDYELSECNEFEFIDSYSKFMENFSKTYIKDISNYFKISFIFNVNTIECHLEPKSNDHCFDYEDHYYTFVNFPYRVLHSIRKCVERYHNIYKNNKTIELYYQGGEYDYKKSKT